MSYILTDFIIDIYEPLSIFLLTGSLVLFVTAPTVYLIMRNRKSRKDTCPLSKRGRYLHDVTPEFKHEPLAIYPERIPWRLLEKTPLIWQMLGYGLASLGFVILHYQALLPLILILMTLLIAYLTYIILGFLKPRPNLRLTPGHPTPGSSLKLEWWFPSRYKGITKLKLVLCGFEKVKKGNSFELEKNHENIFFEELLLETTHPEEILSGSLNLDFPDFLPMSFKTKNQEIVWEIHTEWATSYWPDLKNDYIIQVAPGPII